MEKEENDADLGKGHQDVIFGADDTQDIIAEQYPGHKLSDYGRHAETDKQFAQ
jgi:hypothetical protein